MRLIATVLIAGSLAFAQADSEQVTFFEETQVTSLLKKGDEAAAAKDWAAALDAYQKIVDSHADAVLQDSRNLWLPAVAVIRRRVAALPAEGVAEYVERYQRAAAALAGEGGDDNLRKTALRYFCTPAGADAMERLGLMYAESGALENAARCWEEIYLRHPDRAPRPAMLARLALLYRRLGDARALEGLLAAHGTLVVRSRGADTTIAALLKAGAAAGPHARDPFSVNSDLSLTPLADTAPVPRSVKWRLKLRDGKQPDQPRRRPVWVGMDEGVAQTLQTYPHVAGDRLIVNIGRGLLCLDVASGETRWMSLGVTLKNAWMNVSNDFWMHRFYATVADGVVYWNQYQNDNRCRLAASYVADGKSFWDPPAGDIGEFDLTGPPLAWQNRVYVGAVSKDRPNDTWLLAFDRRTGALLWKRFLVGFEATGGGAWGGDMPTPRFSPVVAAGGSYLFVCSNNGAFLCVDHQGELVWGTKYPGRKQREVWAWIQQQTGETWDLNPVLFHGGDVIFFASDGTHCCRVDGVTGKGWKGSADPHEAMKVVARERCKHLVAMEGDLATLIGLECKIYDVTRAEMARKADGRAAFDELPRTLLYAGRGLATRDAVYVPTQKRLLMYDRKFEKKQAYDWPAGVRPGTLLIANGVLLSVTPSEIVAFSEAESKEPAEEEDEDEEEDNAPQVFEPEKEEAPEDPE
jgi:hypothetical protein